MKRKQPNKKHLPKAGGDQAETKLQKTKRKGVEQLKRILIQKQIQMEILESWMEGFKTRNAFAEEIGNIVLRQEFFENLAPREQIFLWKGLETSLLARAALLQRMQAQGDGLQSFHNYKKVLDLQISLEKERELEETPLPYRPEFRARLRQAYAERVLGNTTEPENQDEEEE